MIAIFERCPKCYLHYRELKKLQDDNKVKCCNCGWTGQLKDLTAYVIK